MNRASFLKLLALPVVAPLVALSTKIKGHWRQEFARDVWVGSDGSEITAEDIEKALRGPEETIFYTAPCFKVRVYQGTNGPLVYTQGFDDTGRRVWNTRFIEDSMTD